MNKKEIINSILHHEELYNMISDFFIEYDIDSYELMDPVFTLIDSEDELGCNFSGDKRVIQFFFLGTSSHFPCIWIGNDDEERIDEMPVYHLDFETSEIPSMSCGNFRNYMEDIIDNFIESCNIYELPKGYNKKACLKEALTIKRDLQLLSTNVINKGDYVMLPVVTEYDKYLPYGDCCFNNDIEGLKNLINNSSELIGEDFVGSDCQLYIFLLSCYLGRLDIIKMVYDENLLKNDITFTFGLNRDYKRYFDIKFFTFLFTVLENNNSKNSFNFSNSQSLKNIANIKENTKEYKLIFNNDIFHLNSDYPFIIACINNHLDVVKWLYKNININLDFSYIYAFSYATEYGNFDVAKYVYNLGNGLSSDILIKLFKNQMNEYYRTRSYLKEDKRYDEMKKYIRLSNSYNLFFKEQFSHSFFENYDIDVEFKKYKST